VPGERGGEKSAKIMLGEKEKVLKTEYGSSVDTQGKWGTYLSEPKEKGMQFLSIEKNLKKTTR